MTRQSSDVNLTGQRRAELNLSREGLAFKAGVSMKTVERIEAGTVTPHRLTQNAIARVLKCSPDDLWPEREAA